MRCGILATAIAVGALTGTANAQSTEAAADPLFAAYAADPLLDVPTQLPPLLPVPDCTPVPKRNHPSRSKRGQVDYDRSLLYLPESLPQSEVAAVVESPSRFWFTPSVIYGWSSPSSGFLIPTVNGGTQPVSAGLATPGRIGYGVNAGGWFTDERKSGLEFGGLYLSQGVARSGPTTLAGPAGVALANSEFRDRYLTALALYHRRLIDDDGLRIDLLLGYRYARVTETATVSIDPSAGPGTTPPNLIAGQARTNFHGHNVGFAGTYAYERWTLGLTGMIAFGESFNDWTANGQNFKKTRFAVLPAVNVRLERALFHQGRAFVGYDVQYLSRAAHAADDLPVFNGPSAVQPRNAEYWFQAVNAGVEIRF